MHAHRFSHTPANAISFHRAAEDTASRQSHARQRTGGAVARSCAKEIAHGCRGIAPALAVDALVVRVFSQTGAAPVESWLRHTFIVSHSREHREQMSKLQPPRVREEKREELIAVTRADGNTLAAFGAPARQHRSTAFCLHAAAEAVGFGTASAIGLKCALRHVKADS